MSKIQAAERTIIRRGSVSEKEPKKARRKMQKKSGKTWGWGCVREVLETKEEWAGTKDERSKLRLEVEISKATVFRYEGITDALLGAEKVNASWRQQKIASFRLRETRASIRYFLNVPKLRADGDEAEEAANNNKKASCHSDVRHCSCACLLAKENIWQKLSKADEKSQDFISDSKRVMMKRFQTFLSSNLSSWKLEVLPHSLLAKSND